MWKRLTTHKNYFVFDKFKDKYDTSDHHKMQDEHGRNERPTLDVIFMIACRHTNVYNT